MDLKGIITMPAANFMDYILSLRPSKKNSKESSIGLNEPDSRLESTLLAISKWIEEIYALIASDITKQTFIDRNKALDFNIKLSNLKSAMVSYCQEVAFL